MAMDIALGIMLALLIIVVGCVILVAIFKSLPEILTGAACVGSLWGLSHFLGGWGVALWFALIIGFISFLDRDRIFKQVPPGQPATKKN